MEINRSVTTLVLFTVSVLLMVLFVWPKYQQTKSLQVTLKEKQAEYNGLAIYYTNIANTLSDIESHPDELQKINSALPDEFALAPIVSFFHKKGLESGLTINSVSFSLSKVNDSRAMAAAVQPGAAKKIQNITFTLNILGNYPGLKNFLSSLEKSARIFEVKAIAFKSGDQSAQRDLATYNFQLEVTTHSY